MNHRITFILLLVLLIGPCTLAQTYIIQVKIGSQKRWGYADIDGKVIIPARYTQCSEFSADGLAPVFNTETREYFFIDKKGKKLETEMVQYRLISVFGSNVEGFNSGLIAVRVNGDWGYLKKNGKMATLAKYDHVTSFNGGYALAGTGSTYYVVDTTGAEVKIKIAGVNFIKHFSEGLAPYRTSSGFFGFMDVHGLEAIRPRYDGVGYFVNGLAWARSGGQVGFINPRGAWVIEPKFEAVGDFDLESGLARVKIGELLWVYVTTSGEIVKISDLWELGEFSNGLARGKMDGKWGFLDNKGSWVIAPQFESTRDFKNGFASVKADGKWGVIDKKGSWVIRPTFDGIKDVELVN